MVIRTILYNLANNVSISVGGAITIQSNPYEEYEECIVGQNHFLMYLILKLMINRIKKYIIDKKLFLQTDNLLLAISGGADSVFLFLFYTG